MWDIKIWSLHCFWNLNLKSMVCNSWVLVVLIMPWLCTVEENQCQNDLWTVAKCTISSPKLACMWFAKKVRGRNHLHMSTFIIQHSYWLIIHLGRKLSYDWSLYTMPAEYWAQCLVQWHPDLFTLQGFLVSPFHVPYNKYKNVHIKWTEENIIRFKFRQNILFFITTVIIFCFILTPPPVKSYLDLMYKMLVPPTNLTWGF